VWISQEIGPAATRDKDGGVKKEPGANRRRLDAVLSNAPSWHCTTKERALLGKAFFEEERGARGNGTPAKEGGGERAVQAAILTRGEYFRKSEQSQDVSHVGL